jgi:tRNA (guanine10-N2)-methyltransferase
MGGRLSTLTKVGIDTPRNDERYVVLVEFAYTHMDFQLAELESVLDMYGIRLGGPDCQVLALPNATPSLSFSEYRHERPFVMLSFPGETASRFSTNDCEERWGEGSSKDKTTAGIGDIIRRCALVRSVVELWGYGPSIEQTAEMASSWKSSTIGRTIFSAMADESQSWRMTIHTLGNKYTREEQDAMMKYFTSLGFAGAVKMTNFDNEYIIIQEVEMNEMGVPKYPRFYHKKLVPENSCKPPLGVYFGRILGGPRKGRNGLEQYNLKNRVFLGPTSMDAELSFVMTSYGQVKKGSVVYDPFVGTGSILLSCALRGAYCVGSDIDIRILKGKSETENIWKNFEQYNLQRPEILRTDNAIYHRHYRDHMPLYDSIICDPPYGIRAGARKTGSRRDNARPIKEEERHDHIPQTKPYAVSDVMSDLLDMASRSLVLGGRLVYVIPSFADFNPSTDLPQHECLQLVHSCYQPLSLELGRRIIAMKKIKEYDPSLRDQYYEHIWVNGNASAEKCANLRDKIWENAKTKPGYEAKAAIRKRKRKEHLVAKKLAKRTRLDASARLTDDSATSPS